MRKLKGFTLIELLVVIAIIGILATVVIINVSSARAKANQSSALSTLDSLQKGMAECIVDGSTLKAATAGGDVCNIANGVKYPALDANSKFNVGKTFAIAATGTTTDFTLTATSVAPDPACVLTCTMSGCQKATSCY